MGVDPSKVVITKLKIDKDRKALLERKQVRRRRCRRWRPPWAAGCQLSAAQMMGKSWQCQVAFSKAGWCGRSCMWSKPCTVAAFRFNIRVALDTGSPVACPCPCPQPCRAPRPTRARASSQSRRCRPWPTWIKLRTLNALGGSGAQVYDSTLAHTHWPATDSGCWVGLGLRCSDASGWCVVFSLALLQCARSGA